jgi:hypothetical protein
MDATAIALSLGLPCLALSLMFAYIAFRLELDTSSVGLEKALSDERIADRLVGTFLDTRVKQCKARILQIDEKISQQRIASQFARQAIVEHRVIIATLNDLTRCKYRQRRPAKRTPTLSYYKPVTLPYHTPVKVR